VARQTLDVFQEIKKTFMSVKTSDYTPRKNKGDGEDAE